MSSEQDVVPFATRMRGTLADGTAFEMRMPEEWNGYLITQPDLWDRRSEEVGEQWLSAKGFASVRHSRDIRRWHLGRAMANQQELVGLFDARYGAAPKGKIVWGGSMGGLLARLIPERFPGQYVGAIPQDGGGEGILGPFERGLDMAFVSSTLLTGAGDRIELTRSDDWESQGARLDEIVDRAATEPRGRARLALAAAVGMMVIWSDPMLPEPDVGNPEEVLDHWVRGLKTNLPQAYMYRVQLEEVVGGIFCGNDDVDYETLLHRSGFVDRVLELYDVAGLSLDDDLSRLADEPRITALAGPRAAVVGDYQLSGVVDCPVLVLKTLGDPDAVPNAEAEYREYLRDGGSAHLLRNAWVNRPGHLNFSVAERAAVLETLVDRIESGRWDGSTSPRALNARAADIQSRSDLDLAVHGVLEEAPAMQLGLSRFVAHEPRRFARSSW